MDIFSHGLYGGIAAGRRSKKDYLWAFFFGMAPDLLAFGPFILAAVLGFEFDLFGSANIRVSYNATHSLIIYTIIFASLWAFGRKRFAKLSLAWPLHILVDIPTHSAEFYPTHFLWPISDFYVDGIAWAQPIIFIPNLIIIVALYAFWLLKRRRTG